MTKNEIALQALALAAQEAYELGLNAKEFGISAAFMFDMAARAKLESVLKSVGA